MSEMLTGDEGFDLDDDGESGREELPSQAIDYDAGERPEGQRGGEDDPDNAANDHLQVDLDDLESTEGRTKGY